MWRFRIRFTSAAAVLLLVTMTALWIRSYAFGDDLFFVFEDGCERVALVRGRVLLQHYRPDSGPHGRLLRVRRHSQAVGAMSPQPWPETVEKYSWIGVRYINLPTPNPIHPGLPSYWATVVPFWLLAAPILYWPGRWLFGWARRSRRRRTGLCPECGYSLMANTTGVCPECGVRVAARSECVAFTSSAVVRQTGEMA